MKSLVRIVCVLIAGLIGACGGGGGDVAEPAATAQSAPDSRLVLDAMPWDQGDWAD